MKSRVIQNTASLYVLNIAKLIFPLITLPYLTRVLSVETYGVVSYVKALMSYMQILVDFGFILSATKDIVNAQNNQVKTGQILMHTILAKVFLGIAAFFSVIVCIAIIPLLRENRLFTVLMFVPIFLTIFLADFFSKALKKCTYLQYALLL